MGGGGTGPIVELGRVDACESDDLGLGAQIDAEAVAVEDLDDETLDGAVQVVVGKVEGGCGVGGAEISQRWGCFPGGCVGSGAPITSWP